MPAGNRVTTVQPSLVGDPTIGGPTAQEGIAAVQKAFEAGILNYDEILDGLTVKPLDREAKAGKLRDEIAKQKAADVNRPLQEEIDRLKLEGTAAEVGVAAGIAKARQSALGPLDIQEIGAAEADSTVLASRKKLGELEADLRKAHDLVDDPEGLKTYYKGLVSKYEGDLRPGMSLDELKREAQSASERFKRQELEKLEAVERFKGAVASAKTIPEGEAKLRAELAGSPAVKTMAIVRPQFANIAAIAERDAKLGQDAVSAADDMALIYSFIKMIDPNSAVKEGEYAAAEATRGIPDKFRAWYNKAWTGAKLTSQQRQEVFAAARTAAEPHQKAYNDAIKSAKTLATQLGYDPSRVVDVGGPLEPEKPSTAGTVPKSWTQYLPKPTVGVKKGSGPQSIKPPTNMNLPPGVELHRSSDGTVRMIRRTGKKDSRGVELVEVVAVAPTE